MDDGTIKSLKVWCLGMHCIMMSICQVTQLYRRWKHTATAFAAAVLFLVCRCTSLVLVPKHQCHTPTATPQAHHFHREPAFDSHGDWGDVLVDVPPAAPHATLSAPLCW